MSAFLVRITTKKGPKLNSKKENSVTGITREHSMTTWIQLKLKIIRTENNVGISCHTNKGRKRHRLSR